MRELVTEHLERVSGVGARRPTLHDDATRLRERDGRAPLRRARSNPLAKALSIGRDGHEHTLLRSRQSRKGVSAHGSVEQRRRQRALAFVEDGSESAAVDAEGRLLGDGRWATGGESGRRATGDGRRSCSAQSYRETENDKQNAE